MPLPRLSSCYFLGNSGREIVSKLLHPGTFWVFEVSTKIKFGKFLLTTWPNNFRWVKCTKSITREIKKIDPRLWTLTSYHLNDEMLHWFIKIQFICLTFSHIFTFYLLFFLRKNLVFVLECRAHDAAYWAL